MSQYLILFVINFVQIIILRKVFLFGVGTELIRG